MVLLSFWLHLPVTSDVHLRFFLLSAKRLGKGVSTFKSEVALLSQNKVARCVQMRREQLYQVEESEYLGVIFTYESKRGQEIDSCCFLL